MQICRFYKTPFIVKLKTSFLTSYLKLQECFYLAIKRDSIRRTNRKVSCGLFKILITVYLSLSLSPALAQNQSQADEDFTYAEKLANDGYYDLSNAQFEQFLQKYPGERRAAEALRRIGEGWFKLERYEKSRQTYEKLLLRFGASPQAFDALFQIAACFEKQDSLEQAARNYERFALIHDSTPQAAEALMRAGTLQLSIDRIHGRKLLFDAVDKYARSEDVVAQAQIILLRDFIRTEEYNRAFRLSEQFLRRFPESVAGADVFLARAELHQALGQYQKAQETLTEIERKFKGQETAVIAALRSGNLFSRIGDHNQALSQFSKVINSSNDSLAAIASFQQARTHLEANQFTEALSVLANAPNSGSIRPEHLLMTAQIRAQLRDYSSALAGFERVASLTKNKDDSLFALACLEGAKSAAKAGNAAQALNLTRRALKNSPAPSLEKKLHLTQADVYFELYEDAARATRLYGDFIDEHSDFVKIDEVQCKLALAYEKLQSWKLALAEWRRLQSNYPASEYFETAKNHIELIEKYYTPDYARLAAAWDDLGRNGGMDNNLLREARLNFHFKKYDRVIPLLRQAMASATESGSRAQAWTLLGQSYFVLGDMARLENRDEAKTWYDSAAVTLNYVKNTLEAGRTHPQIDLMLGYIALRDIRQNFSFLDSLSAAYASQPAFSPIHVNVFETHVANASPADSLRFGGIAQRLSTFRAVAQPAYKNAAALLQAKLGLSFADTVSAMAILDEVRQSPQRNPAQFEANLLAAKIHSRQGRLNEAFSLLNEIRTKARYSTFAEDALAEMAKISFAQGRFEDTVNFIQEMRDRRAGVSDLLSPKLPAEPQFLLGRAFESRDMPPKAIAGSLDFVRDHGEHEKRTEALLALGKLSVKIQAFGLAQSFFGDVIKRSGEKSRQGIAAKFGLAEMAFDFGDFKEASRLAAEIVVHGDPATERPRAEKIRIIANLRLGNISGMNNSVKNFKRNYKDDEAIAEIEYEVGSAYVRQKNFRQAERSFKEVQKKYKGTSFAIRGDFGLGNALLVQNKMDDALKALTSIPQKYPDDPFLRVVYYNLGRFYKEQRQLNNAAQAFKKAIEDSIFDATHRESVLELAELYEEWGFHDVSLKYYRDFLDFSLEAEQSIRINIAIGRQLRNLRRHEDAVAHYRRLKPLTHGEDAIEIQYYIGEAFFESEKYEQAISELLKIRYSDVDTRQPWRVTAIFKAGQSYAALNNFQRAREMYDLVVRLDGSAGTFGKFAAQRIKEIDQALSEKTANLNKS